MHVRVFTRTLCDFYGAQPCLLLEGGWSVEDDSSGSDTSLRSTSEKLRRVLFRSNHRLWRSADGNYFADMAVCAGGMTVAHLDRYLLQVKKIERQQVMSFHRSIGSLAIGSIPVSFSDAVVDLLSASRGPIANSRGFLYALLCLDPASRSVARPGGGERGAVPPKQVSAV